VRCLRPEQVSALVSLYQAGATVNELGRHFGISRKTVSAHLQRAGVPRRYRLLDADAVAEASRLYQAGLSLARIAGHFKVSVGTVQTALRQSRGRNAGQPRACCASDEATSGRGVTLIVVVIL
jgi:DNA-binding CsgD family transcriptional regulator